MPEGSEWSHVGHSILLLQNSTNNGNCISVNNIVGLDNQVVAHRFDKNHPSSNFMKHGLNVVENLFKGKVGNEIHSYLKDLEKLNSLPDTFVGEDVGNGICGQNLEIRFVV